MTFLGNIHSSFRRPVHLAAASLLLSFALFATRSLPAAAQRFEKTVERNAWNLTSNVCGVRADSISISQAQLYGRYNTTFADKALLDMHYIQKASFLWDLQLIFYTLKIIFVKESTEGVETKPAEPEKKEPACAGESK